MTFYGIIEADPKTHFMLGFPILGMGFDNKYKYIGPITGDLKDLGIGHVRHGDVHGGFKDFIFDVDTGILKNSVPSTYKISICTHKEACEKALEYLKNINYDTPFDLTLMRNKLSGSLRNL